MLNYILITCIIILTCCLLYVINLKFNSIKNKKLPDKLIKLNIISDCIVVLSREDCPYCTLLEEQLVNQTKKYTVIKVTTTANFLFDDTFTSLNISERENIIQEVKKIIETGVVYFPTIIANNVMYTGLPKLEKIKELFN